MADFNGAKPSKTIRDNEFRIQMVDGASGETATKLLSVAGVGDAISAGTNDYGVPVLGRDASGNYTLLEFGAGGGVIVEATDLDIRDLTHVSDSVSVGDGTDILAISATGEASVDFVAQSATGDAVPAEAVFIAGSDGTNVVAVAVTSAGFVKTVIQEQGSEVLDYQTTATVGANSVTNHDYTVTDTLEFRGLQVLVGARGAVKVDVGTYDGVSVFTKKYTYFQDPKENRPIPISQLRLLGDGTVQIRVSVTNLDGSTSDVYSTVEGREVAP